MPDSTTTSLSDKYNELTEKERQTQRDLIYDYYKALYQTLRSNGVHPFIMVDACVNHMLATLDTVLRDEAKIELLEDIIKNVKEESHAGEGTALKH